MGDLNFGDIFINVLAIIGIIIAGGFIIFFFGDLLLSILDPVHSAMRKKKNSKEQTEQLDMTNFNQPMIDNQFSNQQLLENEEKYVLPYAKENKYEEVDYVKALEEERNLKQLIEEEKKKVELQSSSSNAKNIDKIKTNKDDVFSQLLAEEETYKKEKIKETTVVPSTVTSQKSNTSTTTTTTSVKSNKESEDYDFGEIFFSGNADFENDITSEDEEIEIKEETKDELPTLNKELSIELGKPLNDGVFNSEKFGDIREVIKEKNKKIEQLQKDFEKKMMEKPNYTAVYNQVNNNFAVEEQTEIQRLRFELERIRAQNIDKDRIQKEKEKIEIEKNRLEREKLELQRMLSQVVEKQEALGGSKPLLTVQDFEERITLLKDRLVVSEKELKSVEKEFLPLMMIRNSLEHDRKALKRKETQFSKMSPESKNYLNTLKDLEQLRLSVGYCEQAILSSADKYIMLENTYRILTTSVNEMKTDIETMERQLIKMKK